jgi:hypothetical protein
MPVLTLRVTLVYLIAGPERQPRVTVRPMLVVLMGPHSVPVRDRVMHVPIMSSRARRLPDPELERRGVPAPEGHVVA